MYVTSIDVISLNGKITKGADADAHSWTSDEDWEHFKKTWADHDVLVMGRGTYESVHPEPEPERLRVILTHHPEEYKTRAVPGQMEFMDASPQELLERLEARGYKRILLVGGQVNTQFWAADLVDQAFVTVEPLVFGQGRNLLDGADLDVRLQLQSVKQLNKRGTLLLHYLVDKG